MAGKMGKQGVGRFMDLPMTIGFQAYRGSNPLTNGHTEVFRPVDMGNQRPIHFYRLILLLNGEFSDSKSVYLYRGKKYLQPSILPGPALFSFLSFTRSLLAASTKVIGCRLPRGENS